VRRLVSPDSVVVFAFAISAQEGAMACSQRSYLLILISIFTIGLLAVPAASFAQSSAENREKSTVYLGAVPVGLHTSTLLAPPVTLAVYLGSKVMIGAEYGAYRNSDDIIFAQSSDDSFDDLLDDPRLRNGLHTNAGVYLRYFPYNSFFVTLGFNRRTFDGTAIIVLDDGSFLGKDVFAQMNTEAAAASVSIGNLWQFNNGFTLGGTWGLFSTMTSSASSFKLKANQGLTTQETDEAKKSMRSFADVLNRQASASGFAMLMIGWSF
jgi:hypothetical protein